MSEREPHAGTNSSSEHTCDFCNPAVFQELSIKEYDYWNVQLHSKQNYLGRTVVVLKDHKEDYFDTTPEEQTEWAQIGHEVRNATREIFQPDLLNYGSLGNEMSHVHWHIIPRYKRSVSFGGRTFEDNRAIPYATDKGFILPQTELFNIRDHLKAALNSK